MKPILFLAVDGVLLRRAIQEYSMLSSLHPAAWSSCIGRPHGSGAGGYRIAAGRGGRMARAVLFVLLAHRSMIPDGQSSI